MGWRYFLIAMGGLTLLMFALRFLCFTIFESPKYLMGQGRDEDAVRIVHEVAKRNGKTSDFALEDLRACEPEGYQAATATKDAVARRLRRRGPAPPPARGPAARRPARTPPPGVDRTPAHPCPVPRLSSNVQLYGADPQ